MSGTVFFQGASVTTSALAFVLSPGSFPQIPESRQQRQPDNDIYDYFLHRQ